MKTFYKILFPVAALIISAPAFAIDISPDTLPITSGSDITITCDFDNDFWALYTPKGNILSGSYCVGGTNILIPNVDLVGEYIGNYVFTETTTSDNEEKLSDQRNAANYLNEDNIIITGAAATALFGSWTDYFFPALTANTGSAIGQIFPVVALTGGISLGFLISLWTIKRISDLK